MSGVALGLSEFGDGCVCIPAPSHPSMRYLMKLGCTAGDLWLHAPGWRLRSMEDPDGQAMGIWIPMQAMNPYTDPLSVGTGRVRRSPTGRRL
jgi:hypothetical protein